MEQAAPFALAEMAVRYILFIVKYLTCIKQNEINTLTPAGILHCEAIFHMRSVFHKSRKGFISLKKTDALYQSIGLFLAEVEGVEPPRRY